MPFRLLAERNTHPNFAKIIATTLAAFALFLVPLVARAEENRSFFVPVSGKITVSAALSTDVSGLKITDFESVMELYDRVANTEFSNESIRDWTYLEKLGARKEERPKPPLPPGIDPSSVKTLPKWREMSIAFNGDYYVVEDDYRGANRVEKRTSTPKSDVEVTLRNGAADAYHHFNSGQSQHFKVSVERLLSRSKIVLEKEFSTKLRDNVMVMTATEGDRRTYVLCDPTEDIIHGIIREDKSGIFQFTFHLRQQDFSSGGRYKLPGLTCSFYKQSKTRWFVNSYIVKSAKLDVPVPSSAFEVPIERNTVYIAHDTQGKTQARRAVTPFKDIASMSPEEAFIKVSGQTRASGPPASLDDRGVTTSRVVLVLFNVVLAIGVIVWIVRSRR